MHTYLRPLLFALPVVLAASLVEALVLTRRHPGGYDWRAAGVSLADLVGRQVLAFLPLSLAAPAFAFAWDHRLLSWLGFPPNLVLLTLSLNLLYQFWIHATWIPRLGWLEYVLNTPSAHRVHHASNLAYLDANYGGVLIVFDRLFGTYVPERLEEPCRYGLVKPITSYSLLEIEFRAWREMARDVIGARSVGDLLGYLFGPPGWRPDGAGATTEDLRRARLVSVPSSLGAEPALMDS